MSTLSTGLATFVVPFDNGDTGTISFRPHDRGIQERIKMFESNVADKVRALCDEKQEALQGASGLPNITDPGELAKLDLNELRDAQDALTALLDLEKSYNEAVKEEIDKVFDSKVSEVAFRYCEPFDVVLVTNADGKIERKPYVVNFFEWLMEELAEYNAKDREALDKHIGKYRK